MSKILKILKNHQNSQNSQKKNSQNSQNSQISQKVQLSTLLHFLWAPHVTVPVVLWAEACPFAFSSTKSLSTTGPNILCV